MYFLLITVVEGEGIEDRGKQTRRISSSECGGGGGGVSFKNYAESLLHPRTAISRASSI